MSDYRKVSATIDGKRITEWVQVDNYGLCVFSAIRRFCKTHAPAFEFISTAREEKPGLWRGECYSQTLQMGFVAWVDLNADIRNGRYTMHTIDGGVIARFDDVQHAGDAMADRLRMGSKPAPGYVFDSAPDRAFPFTVYRPNLEAGPIAHTGTQCKDFAEVCKAWGRA